MPLDLNRIQAKLSDSAVGPLYQRLRLAIQAQILDGTLQPGEPLPPERELQAQIGVSRSTVRQAVRALADGGMLHSRVGSGNFIQKQKSDKTAKEQARGLVGMVASEMNFYLYYAQVYATFSLRVRHAGYRVDMSTCDQDLDKLKEIADDLIELQASGVAINPPPITDISPVIQHLQSHGIPVVIVGRHSYITGVDYVGADHEGLGFEATQHLLQLGHESILYVGPLSFSSAHERAWGHVRAMQAAGLPPRLFRTEAVDQRITPPASLVPFVDPCDELQPAWDEVKSGRVTAIFAFNDEWASWTMHKVLEMGVDIPGDLSIVSIDNLPFQRMFPIPHTSFSLPGEEVGQTAADLLLRRLSGESFPLQRILIPGRLAQRMSTAPPHAHSA